MKLTVGKRILMFLHWLLSLLICAALVMRALKVPIFMKVYGKLKSMLTPAQLKILIFALLALYVVLAIVQLFLIFRRRRHSDRGFIVMDSSEGGRVRIAISAIEQMVRESVTDVEGITDMKIKILNDDDAVDIAVNASIVNGGHVPTITLNMQQAIRQFVEMNCGVAVRAVPISIKSVTDAPSGSKSWRKTAKAQQAAPAAQAPSAPAPVITPEPVFTPAPVEEPVYQPEPEPAFTPSAPEPAFTAPEPEPEPSQEPMTFGNYHAFDEVASDTEATSEDAAAEEAPVEDPAGDDEGDSDEYRPFSASDDE